MGLAGPRKRRKIGQDPNNTAWSRSESGFGHKILTAQGWTPGDYLGATNAPQSKYFSDASASHIRVLLRDDNRGLGAKQGHGGVENFGLASLQDLYGRLNGKTDTQLKKEERYRADVDKRLYLDRKLGSLRFIRGGFLVGDRIESDVPEDQKRPVGEELDRNPEKTLEKRQGGMGVGKNHEDVEDTPKYQKRSHKKKKKRSRTSEENAAEPEQRGAEAKEGYLRVEQFEISQETSTPGVLSSAERKARRRQRKLNERCNDGSGQPRSQCGELLTSKAGSLHAKEAEITKTPSMRLEGENPDHAGDERANVVEASTRSSEPRASVRKRFIHQKKLSSMNPEALREILMLKA